MSKHLPINLVQWTLESMYHGLIYWATEYYDTQPLHALGCSPREAFPRFPLRNHPLIFLNIS